MYDFHSKHNKNKIFFETKKSRERHIRGTSIARVNKSLTSMLHSLIIAFIVEVFIKVCFLILL